MLPSEKFMGWFAPLVLIGFLLFFLFGNTSSYELLCESGKPCLRDWIFGLSGWVAAGAAALTIRTLYKQAEAQQRQTDFQLGDADPTMDAVQHMEMENRVVIRIRNWNRRSMLLRTVQLKAKNPGDVTLVHLAFDADSYPKLARNFPHGWTFSRGPELFFRSPLLIEGWVLREKEPPLLKFDISATTRPNHFVAGLEWMDFEIVLEYELVGMRGSRELSSMIHISSAPADIADGVDGR